MREIHDYSNYPRIGLEQCVTGLTPYESYLAKKAELEAELEKSEQSILMEAEGLVNGARRDDYGPAEEGFRKYAVGWSEIIGAPVTPEQVCLCMTWLKICRELNGHKRDSLVDGAGYLHLAHLCAEAAQ